jgi:hypothetical protein
VTVATPLERFRLPLTGQEIELQQLDYEGGRMSQLRIRIREGHRFTTVDVDPVSARHFAEAMSRWAERHAPSASGPSGAKGAERDG